jgi:signal transduction histidine kinase
MGLCLFTDMRPFSSETLDDYRALNSGGGAAFWVRLGIGVFVAGAADLIAPSAIPLVWFVAMVASQLFSAWFMGRFILSPNAKLTPRIRLATIVVTFAASLAYVAIAAYLWCCGAVGQVFGTTVIFGSLLHVALYRQSVRSVLIFSTIGPCLFLFGLPIASAIAGPRDRLVGYGVLIMAGALYIGHLAAAVGQTNRLTASLRAASRSKSAFLATLSHEIRTPLNAVTSAAHLLGRTELTTEQAEHVSILLTGSEVLLSLINDVLDMSKIEAGKLSAEISDVDIRDLTGKLTALWTPKAAERGLTLDLVMPEALVGAIRTDPLRLNQILFNLLSNAVKFTAKGGVKLVISTVDAGPSPEAGPGARLRFEVIDTGVGMTDEVMSRLFRSFEQADAGVAQRHGGTGLGLAISRKLAELLGGDLTVRSTLGVGSTFTLEIPLVAAADLSPPSAEDAPPSSAVQSGRRLSILLAEDHPVNRRLVDLILRPMGWELTMVENGAEAVEAAGQRPFDVILLDMQMPVMSGIEAARLIKAGGGPNAATPARRADRQRLRRPAGRLAGGRRGGLSDQADQPDAAAGDRDRLG